MECKLLGDTLGGVIPSHEAPLPAVEIVVPNTPMLDLAPEIHRQRLVIEGVPAEPITAAAIVEYLHGLSATCGMVTLLDPVTHRSDKFGWAGWIHWETSGAHFYAWESPRLFFSVDIYTCKRFDPEAAAAYTDRFFRAAHIVAKAF